MGDLLPKILDIVLWDDSILKAVCTPFELSEFGPGLVELGEDMLKTIEERGLGLSGPQVGISKRIFVIGSGAKLVAINPQVAPYGEWKAHEERCLSIPGLYGLVSRKEKCVLTYQNPLDGTPGSIELEGFDSFCAQHEDDHLNGIMCFERMPKHYKKKLLAEWEKKNGHRH